MNRSKGNAPRRQRNFDDNRHDNSPISPSPAGLGLGRANYNPSSRRNLGAGPAQPDRKHRYFYGNGLGITPALPTGLGRPSPIGLGRAEHYSSLTGRNSALTPLKKCPNNAF